MVSIRGAPLPTPPPLTRERGQGRGFIEVARYVDRWRPSPGREKRGRVGEGACRTPNLTDRTPHDAPCPQNPRLRLRARRPHRLRRGGEAAPARRLPLLRRRRRLSLWPALRGGAGRARHGGDGKARRRALPDLVVVACNTASTLVLPHLRAAFPASFRRHGAGDQARRRTFALPSISVLATPGTVARDYTHDLIARFAHHCAVTLVGSAPLPALAEEFMHGRRRRARSQRNRSLFVAAERSGPISRPRLHALSAAARFVRLFHRGRSTGSTLPRRSPARPTGCWRDTSVTTATPPRRRRARSSPAARVPSRRWPPR